MSRTYKMAKKKKRVANKKRVKKKTPVRRKQLKLEGVESLYDFTIIDSVNTAPDNRALEQLPPERVPTTRAS